MIDTTTTLSIYIYIYIDTFLASKSFSENYLHKCQNIMTQKEKKIHLGSKTAALLSL